MTLPLFCNRIIHKKRRLHFEVALADLSGDQHDGFSLMRCKRTRSLVPDTAL